MTEDRELGYGCLDLRSLVGMTREREREISPHYIRFDEQKGVRHVSGWRERIEEEGMR